MENINRTLEQVINQESFQQGQGQQRGLDPTQSYNAYLTVFSIACVHKFSDVTDLSTIQYDSVRVLSRACLGFTKIALETWNEVVPQYELRKSRITQQRAG